MPLSDCSPSDLPIVLTLLAVQLGVTAPDAQLLDMLRRMEERGLIEVNVDDDVIHVVRRD